MGERALEAKVRRLFKRLLPMTKPSVRFYPERESVSIVGQVDPAMLIVQCTMQVSVRYPLSEHWEYDVKDAALDLAHCMLETASPLLDRCDFDTLLISQGRLTIEQLERERGDLTKAPDSV